MRRRGRCEIGEEELGFRALLATLQLDELAVARIEAKRRVRIAARHVAHELLQLYGGAIDDRHRGQRGAVETGEARFQRLAEARRPGKADHVERAAHLVQVLAAVGEGGGVEAAAGAAGELLAHALERLVDLGGNPRKDGGVGHAPFPR